MLRSSYAYAIAGVLACGLFLTAQNSAPDQVTWRFDRLNQIGGNPVTVEGSPQVIDTPAGKAIQFNGINDALFVDVHPLAGAQQFTWEVVFRPDADGAQAQRFFHLQARDPANGKDTADRMLFELRVIDKKWAVDSFVQSGKVSQVLYDEGKLHSLGEWHHVAVVYDGKQYRNYVDRVQEGSAVIQLDPQLPGHSSVGVRINRVNYFKGAILIARMTRRPLAPEQFLAPPDWAAH